MDVDTLESRIDGLLQGSQVLHEIHWPRPWSELDFLNLGLLAAVCKGDEEISLVNELIDSGADIYTQLNGRTLLAIAAKEGHVQLLHRLVDEGLTFPGDMFMDYLEDIIKEDRLDIMQALLRHCNINIIRDFESFEYDFPPLYFAIKYRSHNIIRLLIQSGFDVNAIVTKENFDDLKTPLHFAAKENDWALANVLLQLGASVHVCTKAEGEECITPFTMAIIHGHKRLAVKKLLPRDINACNPLNREQLYSECGVDDTGFTMLLYAVYSGHLESVKTLIELGADPNLAVNNLYPLQAAIIRGLQDIIDYLHPISNVAFQSWNTLQLSIALSGCLLDNVVLQVGDENIVQFLQRAGLTLNEELSTGFHSGCAMTIASINNYNDRSLKLPYVGWPRPSVTAGPQPYALWWCVKLKSVDCLRALIESNTDMSTMSKVKINYGPPIWLESEDGIRLLVEATTPVQEALIQHSVEMVVLCVESGCSLLDCNAILEYVKGYMITLPEYITDLIEEYDSSPRSLQHLAKFAVRRCLGHRDVEARIDALPLPQHLQDYIGYVGL